MDSRDIASILDEFEGAFGVILWKAARAVDPWARPSSGTERSPFVDCVGSRWSRDLAETPAPPACKETLRSLFRELPDTGEANPRTVSALCLSLSAWAEDRGSLVTAVAGAIEAAERLGKRVFLHQAHAVRDAVRERRVMPRSTAMFG